MAQRTREELNAANAALFVNNSTGDITPELEKAYNEDVNDSFAMRYEFDVTITDTAAIQGLNTQPILLVEDDGVSYLQLIAATILMNDDGTTNYDFTGYAGIISTTDGNFRAITASWYVNNTSDPIDIIRDVFGAVATYNLQIYTRTSQNNNSGGLALSVVGSDATEGDHTLRVYGTYAKFPIA
jgi:hypothetical protein